MDWLEKLRAKKEKAPKHEPPKRVKPPVCAKCSKDIQCMDVSIGDVMEDMGACVYGGSEGRLYEPLYEGSICQSCGTMICDNCMDDYVDKLLCPKCGGFLKPITASRLPKIDD